MDCRFLQLKDCLSMITNGFVVKQSRDSNKAGGYPFTRIETLSNGKFNRDRMGYADIYILDGLESYILDDEDILISHINSRRFLGRSVLYKKEGDEIILHGMNVLRVKTNRTVLNPVYANYLFQTSYYKNCIDNIRKDAINQSSFSIGDFQNLVIPVPDIDYQNKIAIVLSSLDSKISLNQAINWNLEALAKQLYDYWFVQFDFPNEDGKPYKSSGGKMVWNEKLKRVIPEGWMASNICKIADILSGGTPSKSIKQYWENGNLPFFGPTDYNGNVFQIETADHITQEGLEHCASSLFEEGTIIITARGSIGKLVIVGTPMAMNQSCYALHSKNDEYEYLYFLTIQLIECLKAKGSGSVFKSIIASDIENSLLCVAEASVVTRFCKVVRPFFQRIKENTIEISELTRQRDELLPLLMNGQVEVGTD